MYLEQQHIRSLLPHRSQTAHKGSCGTVLSLCGSYGMAGAAYFAGQAALRCGAGLLYAVVPYCIYPIFSVLLPEAVCLPDPSKKDILKKSQSASAVLIGCGWGQDGQKTALLSALLQQATCPIVLDADGINLLSLHTNIQQHLSENCVLTPHPGEVARLLKCDTQQVQQDRIGSVKRAATQTNATVVLKGHHTLIAAPDGRLVCNPTGNHGMATGGMGDVLAGMIASFAAQGLSPWDAACCGVYLHGLAGDIAAQQYSKRALLPRDLLSVLPEIFSQWEQQEETTV